MNRSGLVRRASSLFALDTRSLALFRIALGLIVAFDAAVRLSDVGVFYSDAGAVPRALVNELRGDWVPLSLYFLNGSAAFAGALLALHALAGLCLAVGYRTRIATAVAWLLTFSIQHRNVLVEDFGDLLLRLLLFWSLFLPLGARASIDARRAREPAPRSFTSFGSAAFVIQLACVYLFTALLKTGVTWQDGSAIAVSLANDAVAKLPQAAIALDHPQLLAVLTHVVRYFEIVAPLLLFVPFALGPLRTALVLVFWAFHLGLYAMLALGLFSFVCLAAWSALLPGWLWDRLGVAEAGAATRRPQWIALAALALVLFSNASTLFPNTPYPAALGVPLRVSGLYQRWGMFAPDPSRGDGWIVAVGQRRDGTEEDLLQGGHVSWAKPAEVSSLYANWRWSKYMRAVAHRRPPVREAFARWLCERENARRAPADQLAGVALHYLTDVPAAVDAPRHVQNAQVWSEPCRPGR